MPPNWVMSSFVCSFRFFNRKDSITFENNGVQDKFRSSPSSVGLEHFGITMTDSFFQRAGQLPSEKDFLKMTARGMARRSQCFVTSFGGMSPGT